MNTHHPRTTARRCALIGAVIALLSVFAALCMGSGWNTSPAFDEPFFIGAGYSFLKGGEFAPTGNLALPEKWVALPLLAMKVERSKDVGYRISEALRLDAYRAPLLGSTPRMLTVLRAARAMNVLLGVALALVVFFWSRRLHGNAAGLISLSFCCLCPVVISNSGLATTDIAAALFFSLAVWSFWTLLHRVSVWTVLGCGLALGGLLATKFSGVLIVPMAVLMLAVRLKTTTSRRFFLLVSASVAASLVAYIVLWAIYGFHYSFGAQTPDGSPFWHRFDGQPKSLVPDAVIWCRKLRLFPESFLIDLRLCAVVIQHRRAFLMGRYSLTGWWYFFPVAWLLKTPVPFMIALLAGLISATSACRRRWAEGAGGAAAKSAVNFYEFTPLAVLFVVYLGTLMASRLNIGIRHLLPIYPALFIFAGALARARWQRLSGPVLAGALIAWSACEMGAVYPQPLAYFNQFAGGPKNGYRMLADSSCDWGQDLPAVEKWIDRRAGQPGPRPPVYFSYFGSDFISPSKLDGVILLPSFFDQKRRFQDSLVPGTYIMSATMLQSVYNDDAFGPWSDSYENEYQKLAPLIGRLSQRRDPAEIRVVHRYDNLRFARLCAYLRNREPDERITYGILVYELNRDQLNEALRGFPAELLVHEPTYADERSVETYLPASR
jgi:Dolichyl-phosphate-mannose-protein mannosyltransferase